MSAVCIVNLKKHNLKFEELNNLAKELVRFCLNHDNLAVFFNSFDYGKKSYRRTYEQFFFTFR